MLLLFGQDSFAGTTGILEGTVQVFKVVQPQVLPAREVWMVYKIFENALPGRNTPSASGQGRSCSEAGTYFTMTIFRV